MPREVANTGTKPSTKGKKGSPLGIPKWGWIAAIAVGIVVAYVVMKRSSKGAAANGGTSPESMSSPLGTTDSGQSGGGTVANPPPDMSDLLRALGLIGGGTGTQPSATTQNPSNDSFVQDSSPNDTTNPGAPAILTPEGSTQYAALSPDAQAQPIGAGGSASQAAHEAEPSYPQGSESASDFSKQAVSSVSSLLSSPSVAAAIAAAQPSTVGLLSSEPTKPQQSAYVQYHTKNIG